MTNLTYKKLSKNSISLINDNEIFAAIPRWNRYYISNCGRLIHESRKGKLNLVNPSIDKRTGYRNYTLSKPARYYNGEKVRDKTGKAKTQRKNAKAHRLVAQLYVRNDYPIEYTVLEVHHIDGDCANNYWKNLLWVTPEDHEFIHIIEDIQLMNTEGSGNYRSYNIRVSKERLKMTTHDFITTLKMARKNGFDKFRLGKYWIKVTYKNEHARVA